tara:strand:+ start:313 stop:648 length:336 start_codon:yes stop_codon:yes gene_type:complete
MATFSYTPSFPATERSNPRITTVSFGDGYEQRLAYGENRDPKDWNLVFSNRTNTERDNITAFLEARGGVESFDWTDPLGATGKYKCSDWSVDMSSFNKNTVRANFMQVFEP